ATITACEKCKKDIPGDYHSDSSVVFIGAGEQMDDAPPHCPNCGAAYPWTMLRNKFLARLKRAARSAKLNTSDFHTKLWTFIETSPLVQLALTVIVAVAGTILRSLTFLIIGMVFSGIVILVAEFRKHWFSTQNRRTNILRFVSSVLVSTL